MMIPAGVSSIGASAFYNCTGLTEINYNATAVGDFTSTSNVFYNAGTSGTGIRVNVGANVTKLPAYMFHVSSSSYSPKITSVNFAAGSALTSIGARAFQNCTSLTSITTPDNVTSIGDNAFAYTGIWSNTANNSVVYADRWAIGYKGTMPANTSITLLAGTKVIGSYAFYDCSALTSITIPASVTSIGTQAFYLCSGLTSITIPASVTSIGDYAFQGCSGLTSITIPDSVTSIGSGAFSGCNGLTSITVDSANTSYKSIEGVLFNKVGTTLIQYPASKGGTVYAIPAGVTSIGDYAFYGCRGLTSITIPGSVTSIGAQAFSGCNGLTSITIPDSVMSIGEYAFEYCRGLTSITLGNGVTSIGNSAFQYCSGITSITIPDSVTSIGNYAFSDCSGLTSITIPASVTSIGIQAFLGCTKLASIKMRRANSSGMTLGSYWNDTNGITSGGVIPVTWGYTGE